MTHLLPVSTLRSPVEVVLATEEVETNVNVAPAQSTTADMPRLFVHVAVAVLVNVALAEIDLPSADILPVISAIGHLMTSPLSSNENTASAEVAETLLLTGVTVACAGEAAKASALSRATANAKPHARGFFMRRLSVSRCRGHPNRDRASALGPADRVRRRFLGDPLSVGAMHQY